MSAGELEHLELLGGMPPDELEAVAADLERMRTDLRER